MAIRKEIFGKTSEGENVYLYILKNENGTEARISDFGAVLVSLFTRDRQGLTGDIVLGYDTVAGYELNKPGFGATIGRHANRIGNAEFELNGVLCRLSKNSGGHNLHSGPDGYHRRLWQADCREGELGQSVVLSLHSPHGDQGFPGNLDVSVTYTLTEEDSLILAYRAVSDQDTIVNLTNHTYFNLAGHDTGSILKQRVWIHSDFYTEADLDSIPTGRILPVAGTPMDFNTMKEIGKEIDSDYNAIRLGQGYDHNWVLKNATGQVEPAAKMEDEESGRGLMVYTDLPGMQFYTANFLDGTEVGKNGAIYNRRSGACFETQYYPDSIHHKEFPSPVLREGEEYEYTTVFQFYTFE